jgi:hypothetical protein
MKIVHVSGNGSCLFIAMRMGLELLSIEKLARTGTWDARMKNFGGTSDLAHNEAETLRKLVCKFYEPRHWTIDVEPGVTRKDILLRELANNECATDEDIMEYLQHMKLPGRWGSQPEYIAFACMAMCSVEVYVPLSSGLVLRDTFVHHAAEKPCVKLLFTGCHYDLLVDEDVASVIESIEPRLAAVFDRCTSK